MTKKVQQITIEDDYWTHDIPLFDGVFRYYHNTPRPVRGKIHLSVERYFDADREIVPIANVRSGNRTYVMMHPIVFEPVFTFTVGLYKKPKAYADQESAIGETLGDAKQEGVREVRIGNAQAWYYHEDKTLVLWECYLWDFVRDHPFLSDPNMRKLWISFEHWLIKQFPEASQIATPFNDPIARSPEEYQAFLRSLGYEPIAKAAFGKSIKR